MDLINTPSRTRSKHVYDHSFIGSPKNVENAPVKSSTRRKLNFDALTYEVSKIFYLWTASVLRGQIGTFPIFIVALSNYK